MGNLSPGAAAPAFLRSRPFRPIAVVGLLGGGIATLGGCSSTSLENTPGNTKPDASDAGFLDTSLSDVVGDVTGDATTDGGASDAAGSSPCSGVLCNGVCLASSDCRTCAGATLLCAPTSTCVSSCSGS